MQVKLEIVYDLDTKNVSVHGPTNDTGLCHLLLDLARQSLFAFTMQEASKRRIEVPAGPFALPPRPM
jgi:hypothetical protein